MKEKNIDKKFSVKDEKNLSDKGIDEIIEMFSEQDEPTRPNAGIGANEVEAMVFGRKKGQSEQDLLIELAAQDEPGEAGREVNNIIYDFEKVPPSLVFSEFAQYRMYKRKTKRNYYINGKILESRIGLDSKLYETVKNRASKVFVVDDAIILFEYVKLSGDFS